LLKKLKPSELQFCTGPPGKCPHKVDGEKTCHVHRFRPLSVPVMRTSLHAAAEEELTLTTPRKVGLADAAVSVSENEALSGAESEDVVGFLPTGAAAKADAPQREKKAAAAAVASDAEDGEDGADAPAAPAKARAAKSAKAAAASKKEQGGCIDKCRARSHWWCYRDCPNGFDEGADFCQ
jgi:hypothetical protein